MSRIFKATNINMGQPLEVAMSEKEIKEMIYKRKAPHNERSSDISGSDPNTTASNIIEQANIEANEILDRINEQAEAILVGAHQQADVLKSSAAKEGYIEGYQEGLTEGKRETEDLANQALAIKEELEEERSKLIQKIENELPGIISFAVKKIIGKEIEMDDKIILDVIAAALNKSNSESAVVRVSQEDYETVSDNKDEVISQCRGLYDIEVKKDLSLDQGDCIVETGCGYVDAGINTQLQKLEESLSELIGNGEDE